MRNSWIKKELDIKASRNRIRVIVKLKHIKGGTQWILVPGKIELV